MKQFEIAQDKAAMKVGTDGVLLGAWATIPINCKQVLDIGTGTGLIALMLAQRTNNSQVLGIEIDALAAQQAHDNCLKSRFSYFVEIQHIALQDFIKKTNRCFDLILSNPPFYTENVSSGKTTRDLARQNQSLPFDLLLQAASQLLNKNGLFSLIVPAKEEERILKLARDLALFPKRICKVRGHANSNFKRSLMEFGLNQTKSILSTLTIEQSRNNYTAQYKNLTKDFYLNL